MNGTIKSLPTAFKMIFKDPVNLALAIIPALISLTLYIVAITLVINNYDLVIYFVKMNLPVADQYAGWIGYFITALMAIFVFILMNWTFIMVVGIIASPFNSMISDRIEKKLTQKDVDENRSRTFKEMMSGLGGTLLNEIKKIIFILILSLAAFFLNLIPFLYPVALIIFCLLIAIQFVDYSWSRHEWKFGACFKDLFSNLIAYGLSGLLFLGLMMIPLVNSIVPSLATSYFTVLWLHRQNKIQTLQ